MFFFHRSLLKGSTNHTELINIIDNYNSSMENNYDSMKTISICTWILYGIMAMLFVLYSIMAYKSSPTDDDSIGNLIEIPFYFNVFIVIMVLSVIGAVIFVMLKKNNCDKTIKDFKAFFPQLKNNLRESLNEAEIAMSSLKDYDIQLANVTPTNLEMTYVMEMMYYTSNFFNTIRSINDNISVDNLQKVSVVINNIRNNLIKRNYLAIRDNLTELRNCNGILIADMNRIQNMFESIIFHGSNILKRTIKIEDLSAVELENNKINNVINEYRTKIDSKSTNFTTLISSLGTLNTNIKSFFPNEQSIINSIDYVEQNTVFNDANYTSLVNTITSIIPSCNTIDQIASFFTNVRILIRAMGFKSGQKITDLQSFLSNYNINIRQYGTLFDNLYQKIGIGDFDSLRNTFTRIIGLFRNLGYQDQLQSSTTARAILLSHKTSNYDIVQNNLNILSASLNTIDGSNLSITAKSTSLHSNYFEMLNAVTNTFESSSRNIDGFQAFFTNLNTIVRAAGHFDYNNMSPAEFTKHFSILDPSNVLNKITLFDSSISDFNKLATFIDNLILGVNSIYTSSYNNFNNLTQNVVFPSFFGDRVSNRIPGNPISVDRNGNITRDIGNISGYLLLLRTFYEKTKDFFTDLPSKVSFIRASSTVATDSEWDNFYRNLFDGLNSAVRANYLLFINANQGTMFKKMREMIYRLSLESFKFNMATKSIGDIETEMTLEDSTIEFLENRINFFQGSVYTRSNLMRFPILNINNNKKVMALLSGKLRFNMLSYLTFENIFKHSDLEIFNTDTKNLVEQILNLNIEDI